jgi:hypothetical protein
LSLEMRTIILTTVVLLVSTAEAICPSGTMQGLQSTDCYVFNENPLPWDNAEERCVGMGGHLVSIRGAFINTYIQSTASVQTAGQYWAGGIYNGAIANKWSWSDSKKWSYTNWATGQPAKSGSICLLINTTTSSATNWYSAKCASAQPYICKVPAVGNLNTAPPLPPSLPTIEPQKCPSGYFSIDSGNLCYQAANSQSTDWSTASSNCQNSGGRLASIPNKAVNDDLALALLTTGQGATYWIGLHNAQAQFGNQWGWTDGSPANFTRWASGEPQSSSTYAYLGPGGRWTSSGYQYMSYVCEIAPNF